LDEVDALKKKETTKQELGMKKMLMLVRIKVFKV
jgi:hypothetical protein